MSAYSGKLMLIKIKSHNNYETIGGLKTTRLVLNNDLIDISNKNSGDWRLLMQKCSIKSLAISGGGIFTDSLSEQKIKNLALNTEIGEFQLTFGNGEIISGPFLISHYERVGNFNEEETYNLTLESAGILTWKHPNACSQAVAESPL
ncbi:phage tail tube protein [Rickettsiales endosymbiont of Stachyamoeba lipophora]|uniref:phage tail tube protein n=1 Tax=Rickettsiales endosymbiont of Stachyamoeba lipophora TaxID=2486578 RepID=UPI000F650D2D|nr:phage tail tube protein [Rickettsiales endosymbiont of Stachyamoeba lipophora]AZL15546.1 hypothetical protein EF513_03135 [Rickettsiales endosymbiont of Stachyamoeba lipophora]